VEPKPRSFDETAETAKVEESAIFSKNERYKISRDPVDSPKCSNCNKLGHEASRCYLRDKKLKGQSLVGQK
jgi:hypothetical protein